jgi:hypothetical protein
MASSHRQGFSIFGLLATSRQLCAEMPDQLMPLVGGHFAEEKVKAELDDLARKLEKKISEMVPVLN